MKAKHERNAQIYDERERGDKLRMIAERHGISIHRVSQILAIERDRRGLPALGRPWARGRAA